MPSNLEVQKIASQVYVKGFDFDPNVDTPVDVGWVDMRDFKYLLVSFFRTVGTGAVDAFKIIANSASDGSGTDVVVKEHAVGSEPDAVGDQLFLEISSQELGGLGDHPDNELALRYVSAQIEFATATDEGVVTYIMSGPRFPREDLTADIVA